MFFGVVRRNAAESQSVSLTSFPCVVNVDDPSLLGQEELHSLSSRASEDEEESQKHFPGSRQWAHTWLISEEHSFSRSMIAEGWTPDL